MKLSIDEVKNILSEIGFPEKHQTDLTAIAVIALFDNEPRNGLIRGKTCMADGARITDIIEYAKTDLGKSYAENTRETIRKHSLKYLVDFGLAHVNADDPKRPVNSGNTNYTLVKEFTKLLEAANNPELFDQMKKGFVDEAILNRKKYLESLNKLNVEVKVPFTNQIVTLSPGEHNIIEKLIVEEIFGLESNAIELAYLGDTRDKTKYMDSELLELIKLTVDEHAKLPDVIGFDRVCQEVFIFESVASSGPVDNLRKKELEVLFSECPYKMNMATVFLKPNLFQKFSTTIAPGTKVYILSTKIQIEYTQFEEEA